MGGAAAKAALSCHSGRCTADGRAGGRSEQTQPNPHKQTQAANTKTSKPWINRGREGGAEWGSGGKKRKKRKKCG